MKPFIAFALLLALAPVAAQAPAPRGYYRFPAIHGDTLVFTAEGDLWVVGAAGGRAERLTSNPGLETNAAISPDGRTVAFTGTYEGPADVYTMPIGGGLPTRRTFTRGATVVGWTPDGAVLYATRTYSTLPNAQLVRLDTTTDAATVVPLSQAADGAYDAAGTLFFTRQAFQGSHTRHYHGGTAQDLWRFGPDDAEARPLTADWAGTSKNPMVWQGRVYFLSDRDGTMNVWSMDPDGGTLKQETHHDGWDVRSASLDGGRIVYQLGADLWLYTIATGDDHVVPITLASDLDQTREHWITKPMDYLSAAHLSPNGDRVVLTARGQVFVAPAGPGGGRLVEASRRPGVRYRSARFAPDGRSLVVLSDQTGETEWWRLSANGIGDPGQLSSDAHVIRFDGVTSPDGKWIAYGDKNQDLWLFDVERRTSSRIASSRDGEFSDLAWSPDSRWLAYVEPTATFSRIVIRSLEHGTTTAVTDDRVDSYSPSWSPDGKWLYFLSDRNFQSLVGAPWGARQPEPYFDDQTKIYQVALVPGLRSPFRPANEVEQEDSIRRAAEPKRAPAPERHGARPSPRAGGDTAKASADSTRPVAIALEGLAGRLYEVPVPPGNYAELAAGKSRLFFLSSETGLGAKQHLVALDIKTDPGEPARLVDDVRRYELSADGKKLLVRKGDELHVIDAAAAAGVSLGAKTRVDLSGWTFSFPPREEWQQMFTEAWRLERDYFYDTAMHGNDWPAVLRKYQPLVERVTDRDELSDLLSQMVSNLSALHTFVYGGDVRRGSDQIQAGSLGALLVRDSADGGWKVARIYRSDPDYPHQLAPLAQPGVDVRDGDVVQMIDGVPTLSAADPAQLLRNQAGRQVRLRVRPAGADSTRDVMVVPFSASREDNLRYDDWEYSRRLLVDSASHDSIGYVHLRAMGGGDIAQWARDFYPVFNRQGLIVDVRHNRGGNIDSWILARLLRKAWMYWQPRIGNPSWNMQWAFRGHAVLLMDEWTASDGEAFSEGFRRLGLGKLIGTRTWGGEIWLSSSNVLVDRGIATAAETGVYGPEGAWLIEGHGVDPDSVVDDLPHATFEGKDAQLDAALGYLRREIREHPVPVPPAPAHPKPAQRPYREP